MTKYLAVDLSSRTGYCYFNIENNKIINIEYGKLDFKKLTPYEKDYDKKGIVNHPNDFLQFIDSFWQSFYAGILQKNMPDVIIIEQTNRGMNRWTQKLLEWMHYKLCFMVREIEEIKYVAYIDTSNWRNILGLRLTKEQRAGNKTIKHRKKVAQSKGTSGRELGGKITVKHLAVDYVNQKFGIELKLVDNDIAEAICLGLAYLIKEQIMETL